MKMKVKIAALFICAVMCLSVLAACDDNLRLSGQSEQLGVPKTVESADYAELNTEGYTAFKNSVETFAADFAAYSYADYDAQDNFAVSPLSVYMALSLAAECSDGDTRREILTALNVSYQQLQTYFSTLYRSLAVERKAGLQTTSLLNLSNSLWVNASTDVKQPCIDSLSNNYYAYSYSADFANNNAEANKAVRDFVKKQTKGLIDKNFELSTETLFALVNTLYLKTIWNTDGRDLPFTAAEYDFTAKDKTVKRTRLLQGDYVSGQAAQFDAFTAFYTTTHNGYKIKFMLPNDGYSVDQIYTSQNIAAVNALTDYNDYDEQSNVNYYTRVLFPEYKCKYDGDIKDVLSDKFGVDLLFKDPGWFSPSCDFSSLSDSPCFCAQIRHVTDLTVDKTGIEGAAVTVIGMDAATSAGPSVQIMADFVVDRAFSFVITDWQNITLFSGVVSNV